jgi:uncharacterized membrane protein
MVWIPFVTFWQITADLPIGLAVAAGHGHEYTGEHVDGWAAVLQPEGWSATEAAELREIVMTEPDGG